MDFLVPLVIGLVAGGAGAYYYISRREVEGGGDVPSFAIVRDLIQSAHYAAFGPVGTPDKLQDDAFNKLWEWAGKAPKGMPRG